MPHNEREAAAPVLSDIQVVDLSAVLSPATIMWPGTERPAATILENFDRDGSFARRMTLNEHTGTHFDAPGHFAAQGATVDDVPADQLVRPLCVLDISDRARLEPNATLTVDDVRAYEADHGSIESGCAVFLHTGWDSTREDPTAYLGEPGAMRFPGYGVEAARLLVHERHVSGLGVDTLSIDPGSADTFPVHAEVSLPNGVWHVENAINLGLLPPRGAWVVVGVPRVAGASGFPARVLALVPAPTS